MFVLITLKRHIEKDALYFKSEIFKKKYLITKTVSYCMHKTAFPHITTITEILAISHMPK